MTAEPRSLADDLRARDDGQLAELLRSRPDLVSPVASDVGQLAARATTSASVARALDRLDRIALQTAEVLAALPDPTTTDAVSTWLGVDPTATLALLQRLALVWGAPDDLHLVRTARQLLGTPAGLGPPLAEALAGYGPRRLAQLVDDLGLEATGDPAAAVDELRGHLSESTTLAALLEDAPTGCREVLDRLVWGPPTGRVRDAHREVSVASAHSPVEWLLARGLLVAGDADTVVLPREIAVQLRGGQMYADVTSEPPPLDVVERNARLVERTAAGAAFSFVRHVEDLLEAWGLDGPSALRSGGIGVRELRRAAAMLDLDEQQGAVVVEMAYVAGLVGPNGQVAQEWWPTPAYDVWRSHPPAERWRVLAQAWLQSTRVAGLVGGRDEKDRITSALGPGLDRATAPEIRRATLSALAAIPVGSAATADSVQAQVAWVRPRRAAGPRGQLVEWSLREAEQLGMTGLGSLSSHARAILAGDDSAAVERLAPLLPEPLDHVLVQADLTAVAPGPLETALAQQLALMADVESKGGATVYRFTPASVRRALDAGRSADELQALLAARSRTPVPQPLAYLIDDAARRHGRVRVGTARAYIRCDDDAVLSELLAHRRSADLRLRRLAPTVVVAQAPPDAVVERLRELGFSPAVESPQGDVVIRRPDIRRTAPRQRPPLLMTDPPTPGDPLIHAAVRALRAGDRMSRTARVPLDATGTNGTIPRSTTSEALAALSTAAASGTAVWIGYTNNDGQASQRVIEPISVEGGYVSAFDHLREEVRTFAVHRITGVAGVAGIGN